MRRKDDFGAWFVLFDAGEYFEAHEVLEGRWKEDGPDHPDRDLHQSLIQLAAAFVHLRRHHEAPRHPVHGRRPRFGRPSAKEPAVPREPGQGR